MQIIYSILVLCILCSGCSGLNSFTKKENTKVLTAMDQKGETETIWIPDKTQKVWVNPHVDEEGNMVEGHYKHVILEKGHWDLQEITPEDSIIKIEAKKDDNKI